MKFKYAGCIHNSLENGEGIRDVIFFSGCSRGCPGCHNPELQKFEFGEDTEIEDIIEMVKRNRHVTDGITISGGDPVYQYPALLALCSRLKEEGFNVWVYTGATFGEFKDEYGMELFQYIDVMIDGRYKEDLKDNKLRYTGSSNQTRRDVTSQMAFDFNDR